MANDGDIAVNPRTGQRLEWQGGAEGGWGTPNIPIGRMGGPPLEPTTEQATQAAAQRQKDTVQPPGGRQEGSATGFGEEAPKGVPILGAAVPTTPAAKRLEEEHPLAAGAARMVGGAAAMAPLAATGAGAAALGMSGPILGRPLASGASGAVMGAADATARGEDPLHGAMVGGATGLGAPVVAGLIGKGIVQPIAEAIGSRMRPPAGPLAGSNPVALKLARDAAKADGLTEEQINAKMIELGPQGFLLDYGPNLENLAGGAAANSGSALTQIKGALGGRVGAARDVIDNALTDVIGPDINVPQYTRFLQSARKKASDPAYEAYRNTQIPMTPELEGVLGRLSKVPGAFSRAKELAGVEDKALVEQFFTPGEANAVSQQAIFNKVPTAEVWDYAKRGLDRIINKHMPWGSEPDRDVVRAYGGLRRDLLNALENHPDPNIGQVYREARQTYAEPSGLLDALEAGQNWHKLHPDEIPYHMADYSALEKRSFLQGVREQLAGKLGGTARGATATREFFLAPDNEKRLARVLDSLEPGQGQAKADQIVAEMERQRQFANTKSGAVDNSKTAARANVTAQMKEASANWAEDALHRLGYSPHVTPLHYVPGIGSLKKSVGEEAADRFKGVLEHTGNLLTTPNPQAAEVAKALLGYIHPGEAAGPGVANTINVLARGAGQEGVKMKQGMAR